MNAPLPRRTHLVERAADLARAAIEDHVVSVARAPLAPVETLSPPIDPVVAPPAPQRSSAKAAPSTSFSDKPAHVRRALLRRAGLVDEAGPAREEIALVREQVLRSVDAAIPAEGRQGRLVMITSAHTGEGKSFVALNLAASIAEAAQRPTILVDVERGVGSLTNLLGLQGAPGLDKLGEKGDPNRLLGNTEIPGLFIMPHGIAEPSDVQGSAMAAALLNLAERLPNHIILIDTPACMERSIAGLLAAAAGQVVLVVEAERTKRAEVEAALDVLDACPTLQLLLNRSALQVSDRFRGRAPRAGNAAVGVNQT